MKHIRPSINHSVTHLHWTPNNHHARNTSVINSSSDQWRWDLHAAYQVPPMATSSLYTFAATHELSCQLMYIGKFHWRVYSTRHSVHVTEPYTGTTAHILNHIEGWKPGKNWPGSKHVVTGAKILFVLLPLTFLLHSFSTFSQEVHLGKCYIVYIDRDRQLWMPAVNSVSSSPP